MQKQSPAHGCFGTRTAVSAVMHPTYLCYTSNDSVSESWSVASGKPPKSHVLLASRRVQLILWVSFVACSATFSGPPPRTVEPELISVFPLGGQSGTAFEVEVRGRALEGAYGVSFECDDLSASVREAERVQLDSLKEKSGGYGTATTDLDSRAVLEVDASEAALGLHGFRLVTPRGVSSTLALQVVAEPTVFESDSGNDGPGGAQALSAPVVVNGKIEKNGDLDFYSFQVSEGQELLFRVFSEFHLFVDYSTEAEIALYEPSGSWFDSQRVTPLVVDGPILSFEPYHRFRRRKVSRAGQFKFFPRLSHRFDKKGQYFVSVTSFLGEGSPGSGYQLRIVPAASSIGSGGPEPLFGQAAHPDPADWLERNTGRMRQAGSFAREISPDRLQELWARTVPLPESPTTGASLDSPAESSWNPSDASMILRSQREEEPNDSPGHGQAFRIPTLIEGTIGRPGDLDYYRFTANAGERLAFEIETSQAKPPQFNPWLKLLDSEGREICENIFKEYGGNGIDVSKTIQRKTIYTFERDGSYSLQIRDLTSRHGGSDFVYRVLVRPQIPHVGRIEVSLGVGKGRRLVESTDRINLVPGQAKEFVVIHEKEEGFEGQIAIGVDDLPPGVELLPGSQAAWARKWLVGVFYRPPPGKGSQMMSPAHHRTEREVTTLVLVAHAEAAPTRLPHFVRVHARPMVAGKPGPRILARRFPVMVVNPQEARAENEDRRQRASFMKKDGE